MVVHPDFQGLGYGRILLDAAFTWALKRGVGGQTIPPICYNPRACARITILHLTIVHPGISDSFCGFNRNTTCYPTPSSHRSRYTQLQLNEKSNSYGRSRGRREFWLDLRVRNYQLEIIPSQIKNSVIEVVNHRTDLFLPKPGAKEPYLGICDPRPQPQSEAANAKKLSPVVANGTSAPVANGSTGKSSPTGGKKRKDGYFFIERTMYTLCFSDYCVVMLRTLCVSRTIVHVWTARTLGHISRHSSAPTLPHQVYDSLPNLARLVQNGSVPVRAAHPHRRRGDNSRGDRGDRPHASRPEAARPRGGLFRPHGLRHGRFRAAGPRQPFRARRRHIAAEPHVVAYEADQEGAYVDVACFFKHFFWRIFQGGSLGEFFCRGGLGGGGENGGGGGPALTGEHDRSAISAAI